jgi:hypothetical protein
LEGGNEKKAEGGCFFFRIPNSEFIELRIHEGEEAMLDERIVYKDGEFVKWSDAQVHMMCHSFARGSTIFEVISFYDTPVGPVVFRLEDHVARFIKSAEYLNMRLSLSAQSLCEAVAACVRRNRLKGGIVKIVGFYQIALDVLPPNEALQHRRLCHGPRPGPGRLSSISNAAPPSGSRNGASSTPRRSRSRPRPRPTI